MKIINTKPEGNRILHVMPDEKGFPQFGGWKFRADNTDILFALLDAQDIDFETIEKGGNSYLVGKRRGNADTGAVVIRFTREGDDEPKDYVIHDMRFGEDFVIACDAVEMLKGSE